MAIKLKNMTYHKRDNPRLAETLEQIETYINNQVTVVAGSQQPQPPVVNAPAPSPPVAQQPQPPTSGVAVPDKNKQPQPPIGVRSVF